MRRGAFPHVLQAFLEIYKSGCTFKEEEEGSKARMDFTLPGAQVEEEMELGDESPAVPGSPSLASFPLELLEGIFLYLPQNAHYPVACACKLFAHILSRLRSWTDTPREMRTEITPFTRSLETLQWVQGDGAALDQRTLLAAAKYGPPEVVSYILENGGPFENLKGCATAAINGDNQAVLEFLVQECGVGPEEIAFPKVTPLTSLGIIRYVTALLRGTPFFRSRHVRDLISGAARLGRLDIVEHMHRYVEEEYAPRAVEYAIKGGHTGVVVFLINAGYPLPSAALSWAIENNHPETIECLLQTGRKWDSEAWIAAARYGDVDLLQNLFTTGIWLDKSQEEACTAAAAWCPDEEKAIAALDYLRFLGCSIGPTACAAACVHLSSHVLDYLMTHGCLCDHTAYATIADTLSHGASRTLKMAHCMGTLMGSHATPAQRAACTGGMNTFSSEPLADIEADVRACSCNFLDYLMAAGVPGVDAAATTAARCGATFILRHLRKKDVEYDLVSAHRTAQSAAQGDIMAYLEMFLPWGWTPAGEHTAEEEGVENGGQF